jgi:hypothetical protein
MRRFFSLAVVCLVLFAWASVAQAQCSNQTSTVSLLVKGTTEVGTVSVSNDQSLLYIFIATEGDYSVTQLDVDAGLALTDLHGSNLTAYPYRTTLNPAVTNYTFAIPLGSFSIGSNLFLAVHARVTSPTQGAANAWGAGTLFPGAKVCGSCSSGSEGEDDGHHDDGGSGYHSSNGHSTVGHGAAALFGNTSSGGSHSGSGEDDCDDDGGQSGGSCGGQKSASGHSVVSLHGSGSSGSHGSGGSSGGSHGGSNGGNSGGSHGGNGGSGDDHHGSDGHGDDGHGDDGHGDDGHGGSGNSGGCGATYFNFVLACGGPVE